MRTHGASAVSADPVPGPRPARTRRWARRIGVTLATVWLLVTIGSLVANALTTPAATFPAPDGLDVSVSGVRVHYREWGTGGSPVVLVHGFVESTAAWSTVGPLLARTHTVYALDLMGYGYTAYTGRYTLLDEAILVDGFIRALGLDRPVLVGHSLGAAVVGAVALAHPGDVRGVVFADGDALPFNGRRGGVPTWPFRLPYVTTAYRIGTRWSWVGASLIKAECGTTCLGYSPALARAWLRPLQQGAAEQALPRIAHDGVLHLEAARIRAIDVPRAVIWGGQDTSAGGSLAAARANLGNPPTRVVPGAGHLSMISQPEVFATDLDELVAGMPVAG